MRKISMAATLLLAIGLAGPALAQTVPQHAYSAGAKLQPRPIDGEKPTNADPAQVESTLDALAKSTGGDRAAPPATDLYGHPLGGDPGLNPPGLTQTKPKS
ncbi:MAG TPA: hypothetical protein VNT30_22420 [Stellaceae bacterium]|nr:hypothetical protein [Stellaceae bacterium]